MPNQARISAIVDEYSGATLGDRRRSRRLEKVAEQLSKRPDRSIPESMVDNASLEGAYRLMENDQVSLHEILAPHVRRTAERAGSCKQLVVAHDTTTFCFPGETLREGLGRLTGTEQGFFSHMSLALESGSQMPLGVVAVKNWIRPRGQRKARKPQPPPGLPNSENACWFEGAEEAQAALTGMNTVHVMDRDADGYTLLSKMTEQGMSYVIRACHRRNARAPGVECWSKLSEVVEEHGECQLEREVVLSKRPKHTDEKRNKRHPPRSTRTAKLICKGCAVELRRPKSCSKTLPESLTVNVVEVTEPDPPNGEPVHWRLLTNLPIDEAEQVAHAVDCYRARWKIEEYFKALKTGCSIEKLQLESYGNILRALAIYMPIAWNMLALRHLAQQDEDTAAELALGSERLDLLRRLLLVHARFQMPDVPSVKQALEGVAKLGGHLKHNGPPGWITIGRGWTRLLEAEVTATALQNVINP